METWTKQFLRWLRRVLGAKESSKSIKILESYYAPGRTVLRIQDTSIPGSVDLWRIEYGSSRIRFFLSIVSIEQFRFDVAATGDLRTAERARRRLADDIDSQIRAQSNILATHYWITGWSRAYSGTDIKGRVYQSYRTTDVKLLACDLQGGAASFAGNKYACRFGRIVVKRLANGEFREYNQHQTWEAAVNAINWAQWLEGLCRGKDGITMDHTLQPRRGRGSKLSDL